jgi:hypothetical protein
MRSRNQLNEATAELKDMFDSSKDENSYQDEFKEDPDSGDDLDRDEDEQNDAGDPDDVIDEDDLDHDYDEDHDHESVFLNKATPDATYRRAPGWTKKAVRALMRARYSGLRRLKALRLWVLSSGNSVMRNFGDSTGKEIEDLQRAAEKRGSVLLKRPLEMTKQERLDLMSRSVRRVTAEG